MFGGTRQTVNQISFLATRTTAQTITANGVLPFNSVVTNIGGGHNGSTYNFTSPLTGTYYFYTQFFTSQNNTYTLYIQKLIEITTTILRL